MYYSCFFQIIPYLLQYLQFRYSSPLILYYIVNFQYQFLLKTINPFYLSLIETSCLRRLGSTPTASLSLKTLTEAYQKTFFRITDLKFSEKLKIILLQFA